MKTLFKTLIVCAVCLLTFGNEVNAQKMDSQTKLIQAGIGLGGWADYTSSTPIISVSYMQGIKDDFLNGRLAVGGVAGFKTASYGYSNWDWHYTYTYVAGRATWHPDFIQSEKFDVYAGLALGVLIVKFDARDDFFDGVDASGSSMVLSGLVGARYSINDKWGAYAEIGSNLGTLTLGASMKL